MVFFFFQAEDGIRDLVRSRGLGDVYKRQARTYSGGMRRRLDLASSLIAKPSILFLDEPTTGPVSYTHLTLPTSDLV